MKTDRRRFIVTAAAAGLASQLPAIGATDPNIREKYRLLDEIISKPVLKIPHSVGPVIIESVELLRYKDNFLCRVRSKDGAEGVSAGNNDQLKSLYPVFVNRIQPFFIGKDARDLESLMEKVYVYQSNYKLQNLALWLPLATLEFALLDMLGRITGKPIGELIGSVQNRKIAVYQANGDRGITAEETLARIEKQIGESDAKAIKFKIGGRMSNNFESPAGRTEKLIPLLRKRFGDSMTLYADSNGSYTAAEAIRIGRILQEYKIAFYEEPVPFDWYEETREVADALDIPVAGGEQEPSLHMFRWLIANDALQIVQPDVFYFGGMLRSVRVARMAEAFGKDCTPHISDSGLGYLYMMHFVSAIPNPGPYHEFKSLNTDIPFECNTSSVRSENGVVTVPSGPGLGIDIDPAFIMKHVPVKI
ncbi:MAG: mandelate racemase/muconate lactonizing enzyme family protein [Bacteroidales bacterium]|nr:mandelate racemase/muconate lactonizing enzyme family protein [Bacteroidales bacterium]